MNTHNINRNQYAKLASGSILRASMLPNGFLPSKPPEPNISISPVRRHDSFSMFDTKESDFNIVDATPFKRDILKRTGRRMSKTRHQTPFLLFTFGLVS